MGDGEFPLETVEQAEFEVVVNAHPVAGVVPALGFEVPAVEGACGGLVVSCTMSSAPTQSCC